MFLNFGGYMIKNIKQSLQDTVTLFNDFIENEENLEMMAKIAAAICDLYNKGNKILICGNGGSATDAMHFAEELTGRFRENRAALPALALTDSSHITCVGNDFGFDKIFSRGVEAFGKKGDMLIAISTSGNSANIIEAVNVAESQELMIFSLLGKDGGALKGRSKLELIIPGKTSDRIQELHMAILHIIIEIVERKLYPINYKS